MATIVKHKNGGRYVVVGFGYGMYKSSRPGAFFGMPSEKSGNASLLAVCDHKGKIGLVNLHDCKVVEVDGKKPSDII